MNQTSDEKIDHIISRIQSLEQHVVNNIIVNQDLATKQDLKSVHSLINHLNEYTDHVKKMHDEVCFAYNKMQEICAKLLKEHVSFGEVKSLSKRLNDMHGLLKTIEAHSQDSGKMNFSSSRVAQVDGQAKSRKRKNYEPIKKDAKYRDYQQRVTPILSALTDKERCLILCRCQPTTNSNLIAYRTVGKEFGIGYDDVRRTCRKATKKIKEKDLAKLGEKSLIKQYRCVTGKWILSK